MTRVLDPLDGANTSGGLVARRAFRSTSRAGTTRRFCSWAGTPPLDAEALAVLDSL